MKLPLVVLLCGLPMVAVAQATPEELAEAISSGFALAISTILEDAKAEGVTADDCAAAIPGTVAEMLPNEDPDPWVRYVSSLCQGLN